MRKFEELSRELEKRGKADAVRQLAESEDGVQLSRMLSAGEAERAAKSGDTQAISELISRVLSTDAGKRLAENVKKMMQDQGGAPP